RNLWVALGQRGLDRSRRRAYERQARRSGMQAGPDGRLVFDEDATPTRMGALRPGVGEVGPKTSGVFGRSLRELPGMRKFTPPVARDIGGQQSVTRTRLLSHRGRVVGEVRNALGRLNEREGSALKYLLQLGATPDASGVRVLRERLEQIRRGRTEIAP